MSSFHSALVILALVAITTATGCADPGGDDVTANVCVSAPLLSPSCVTNTPSPGGTSLYVPTGPVRPTMSGNSDRDFIATAELVSLSPNPNVVQNGKFRFSANIRILMDDLGLREGTSINYYLYTSNDGVNKIAEFGNGYMYTPNLEDIFGKGGMFMMMDPFNFIIVEMKTTLNGQGTLWSEPVKWKVGYAQ